MNKELWTRLRDRLWHREARSPTEAHLLRAGRYALVLARDLLDGQLSMRAMSLVYTTLLSIVPLLALAFSLFKALGVHNMMEPVLLQFLAPLGDKGVDLTATIIRFVENIRVGVLGSLGVALLFYTAMSMIQKVESSFNYIWRIERQRPLAQRFGDYLSVLIVGPVLVFSALGLTASIANSRVVERLIEVEPLGATFFLAGKLVPYVLIVGAFTFVYAFVPNTRVRLGAALLGAVLAGLLWHSASIAFASFVASATKYNAIYSSFAILILLLIWLYIGWLILLTGCQLAFYVQHPEHVTPTRIAPFLSGRTAEMLGLGVMALIGARFLKGEPPLTEEDLSRQLSANPDHVNRLIEVLLHHGLLVETGAHSKAHFLPARDLDSITVGELWRLLRRGLDPQSGAADASPLAAGAMRLVDSTEAAVLHEHGRLSLRDWIRQLLDSGAPDCV